MITQHTAPLIASITRREHYLAGIGLVCLMAALWNVVEELPALLSPGYSLYQVVWMRYAVHLFFMAVVIAPRMGRRLLRTTHPALQIGRGLLMLVMPYCFIRALEFMDTRNLYSLFWLAPLLILTLVSAMRQNRVLWWTWLATVIGCVGVIFILRPDSGIMTAGALFVTGMAASFGTYVVLTRVLRHESTYTSLFYTAACVFVPLSFVMPMVWKMPTARDALVMAGVGLAGFVLLWALDQACERAPLPVLGPFFLLPPVMAYAFHILSSGSPQGRLALIGALLSGGALIFALYMAMRPTYGVDIALLAEHKAGHS